MMFRSILCACLLIAVAWPALAFDQSHIKVFLPGGEAITSELAVSPAQRQQGLMFRERINPDQGMLFVFEREGRHSFWMKNMKFAIDILWLDSEKRIIHIEQGVPPCESEDCPSYAPAASALYVLELAVGSVKRFDLNLYQRLDFILP